MAFDSRSFARATDSLPHPSLAHHHQEPIPSSLTRTFSAPLPPSPSTPPQSPRYPPPPPPPPPPSSHLSTSLSHAPSFIVVRPYSNSISFEEPDGPKSNDRLISDPLPFPPSPSKRTPSTSSEAPPKLPKFSVPSLSPSSSPKLPKKSTPPPSSPPSTPRKLPRFITPNMEGFGIEMQPRLDIDERRDKGKGKEKEHEQQEKEKEEQRDISDVYVHKDNANQKRRANTVLNVSSTWGRKSLSSSTSAFIHAEALHSYAPTVLHRVAFTLSLTIVPIIITGLWILIPITEENGQFNFLVFALAIHPIYIVFGTFASILFMSFYTPIMKWYLMVAVCIVAALVDSALLYLYRPYLGAAYQVIASTIIVIIIAGIVNPVCFVHEYFKTTSVKMDMIPVERQSTGPTDAEITKKKWMDRFWKYFCIIVLQALIIVPFYWCQTFTFLYYNIAQDVPVLNIFLSFIFSCSFIPFRLAKAKAVQKLFEPIGFNVHHIHIYITFSHSMLLAIFSRNLFTKVSSYPELFALTFVRLATDIVTRYALPISHIFYTWKEKIFHDHDTYQDHFLDTVRDYYFCTITGFTSIFGYIVLLSVVKYTSYNFSVYTYGNMADDKYTKLVVLCVSSTFIEAFAFLAVELFTKKKFKVSIIDFGVEMLLEHKILFFFLLILSIHFLQDVHVALLSYSE